MKHIPVVNNKDLTPLLILCSIFFLEAKLPLRVYILNVTTFLRKIT